jgi:hypothetical protein
VEFPCDSRGASSIGISWLGSDFMGRGVDDWDAVETLRSGVGVETAFGSFFLWERVPLLVR